LPAEPSRPDETTRHAENKEFSRLSRATEPSGHSGLCEPADPSERALVSTEVSSSTVPYTEGMILGLVRLREDHGTYWIEDIIVDENCRGQGIGSEILKWAEDWVRTRGATSLFLDVVPANRDALDFFISKGYVYLNTIELRKDFEETVVPDGTQVRVSSQTGDVDRKTGKRAVLDRMQVNNCATCKEGTAAFTQVTFQGRHLLVRGLPKDKQLNDQVDEQVNEQGGVKAHSVQNIESVTNALTHYLDAGECRRIWLLTDDDRLWLARAFADGGRILGLKPYVLNFARTTYGEEDISRIKQILSGLGHDDLVVAAFSDGFARFLPYHKVISTFGGIPGFPGMSAVIRPRYPDLALVQHLNTDPSSIEGIIQWVMPFGQSRIRVCGPGGTDLTVSIGKGNVLPYMIAGNLKRPSGFDTCANTHLLGSKAGNPRHAYLPPSEVYFAVVPGSAQGKIVCDVTVGEFVSGGILVDTLGLVDCPVTLHVEDGYVISVEGGDIARRLNRCFEALKTDRVCGQSKAAKERVQRVPVRVPGKPKARQSAEQDTEQDAGRDEEQAVEQYIDQDAGQHARLVVELGFGLSKGQPTGSIAADESLQGTCHFGLGNNIFYGGTNNSPVHLDVVIRQPEIQRLWPTT
jgi:GNAT superfamily N-acetyltransferase